MVCDKRLGERTKTGLIVCLFGLDGSGKTTIAKGLVKSLLADGVDAAYAHPKFGMRLWTTEPISDAAPHGNRGGAKKTKLHASLERILAGALLIENWLVVTLRIRLPAWRGTTVVAERYWPDTLVDLVVDFGIDYHKARRLVQLLIVKAPTDYFVMAIPSEDAIARKPGPYSLEYLNRRGLIYERLAVDIDAHRIDTMSSPTATMIQLRNAVGETGGAPPCHQE